MTALRFLGFGVVPPSPSRAVADFLLLLTTARAPSTIVSFRLGGFACGSSTPAGFLNIVGVVEDGGSSLGFERDVRMSSPTPVLSNMPAFADFVTADDFLDCDERVFGMFVVDGSSITDGFEDEASGCV